MCCHTEAGFVFFWDLSKNSERESLYEIHNSHGISVEWFFFLVSSYGDLCFKGAWINLKRSTEKNQNLKKDQLKKFFFSLWQGFLSLDTGDTLDQIIPFMLIASPTPVWQPKVSPEIAKCCCGAKFLWVEHHCSMRFSASEY